MKKRIQRIKELSKPLHPVESGCASRLHKLAGVKAVLFDIYGTLLISGSGDVGSAMKQDNAALLLEAMSSLGLKCTRGQAEQGVLLLRQTIEKHQESRRRAGSVSPEVDIRAVWSEVVGEMKLSVSAEKIEQLGMEYECRVNPVWPMPGAGDVLTAINASGLITGIVSNAQYYTPPIMEALFGATVEELGFRFDLQAWSFQLGESKPSPLLFSGILERLNTQYHIQPQETVYVGNDMLNDIWTASNAGCLTVLFAGDQRSLRLREDDERCIAIEPSATVSDLQQLLTLI